MSFIRIDYNKDRSITIIDSEFVEMIPAHLSGSGWTFLVKVYEQRGLNVASNLILAVQQHMNKHCRGVSIDSVMPLVVEQDGIQKYEDDIRKLMVLM